MQPARSGPTCLHVVGGAPREDDDDAGDDAQRVGADREGSEVPDPLGGALLEHGCRRRERRDGCRQPERDQHGGEVQIEEPGARYTLRPGDVLLVEGSSRISTAIKYLTQSTWSHAALFVGPPLGGVFTARSWNGNNTPGGTPVISRTVQADLAVGGFVVPEEREGGECGGPDRGEMEGVLV